MIMRLKDKTAIVTGSSRGVGRSIAEAYGEQGANRIGGRYVRRS